MVDDSSLHGENVIYLENWLESVLESVIHSKDNARKEKASLFFSISTTFKDKVDKPYITPQRSSHNTFVIGVVVNSINQAIIVASIVADHIDGFMVDVERKINTNFHISENLLNHFDIDLIEPKKTIQSYAKKSCIAEVLRCLNFTIDIIHYKPNDLTVEAVWGILALKLDRFEGKKVAIIGCGNIGFKLALKLVESGASVGIFRRNFKKSFAMTEAINITKPTFCGTTANSFHSPLEASEDCDVIIGTGSGGGIITPNMIENMSSGAIAIDVGKGNFDAEAVNKASELGIEVLRGDITAALLGFITQFKQSQDYVANKMGRKSLKSEITILSGGLLGKNGEFIVDDFNKPSIIYGISDGAGNLKLNLSSSEKTKLSYLKDTYKIK